MKKVLNDTSQLLPLLNKYQFIPELCFKIVLSFGWGSHKSPALQLKLLWAEKQFATVCFS